MNSLNCFRQSAVHFHPIHKISIQNSKSNLCVISVIFSFSCDPNHKSKHRPLRNWELGRRNSPIDWWTVTTDPLGRSWILVTSRMKLETVAPFTTSSLGACGSVFALTVFLFFPSAASPPCRIAVARAQSPDISAAWEIRQTSAAPICGGARQPRSEVGCSRGCFHLRIFPPFLQYVP